MWVRPSRNRTFENKCERANFPNRRVGSVCSGTVGSMAARIVQSLPRIQAPIGHIPQRLKTARIDVHRGRLEILRRIVTRLVREERFELKYNRAIEARPYAERLLQLAVERGANDEYTLEMADWWLMEKDLVTKLFEVLVPRYEGVDQPFTSIYQLPKQRVEGYIQKKRIFYKHQDVAILELNGNPFPSVISEPEERSCSLLNVLLKEALKKNLSGELK
uniref:Large ribosomal subunit protein bL17m n=1 Tax=Steinernema glaseri TaxID=37863 RepID=A0A1I8AIR1_9BILA